ncbi:MAG: pyruvate ferredoxin oxidoreductase [Desulfobulbaceae bacterium A2]|nr:MAG: pyruvate ferredoxin oxidoreductase [Desulfobulbaceae bacterium A2]
MSCDIHVLIGGEAGQGLVTIGQLLGRVLVRAGYEVFVSQSYHSRIRGGHNTYAIRLGTGPFGAPAETIDILVALNGETVALHRGQLSERALLVADAAFAPNLPGTIAVPFGEFGPTRLWNTAALALGALAAGLKFCAFYPMTPATSIVLELIAHAEVMGCVIEQAEDEIAAINMAIGAAFAGAPSMVATSGGGFALMVEGVSLAAMTETPLLIVVAQRPGPATGMPTRTEQADLEFVLHAGHGEFPRAVFAPGSIEECFHLTGKGLILSERSQSPVFLLTDQFLADSSRPVTPFAPVVSFPCSAGDEADTAPPPYRRYLLTATGISPRRLPGLSEHLVVADSDEHDEEGHISEDHNLRIGMVEKRLRKLELLQGEVVAPKLEGGEGADLLLLCWGSSQGPVREAAAVLCGQGRKVASLHFSQVWPLVPDQFLGTLQSAGKIVCVEGNATGQFARLIQRETGFAIPDRIGRYDGLPLTAHYILARLQHPGNVEARA